MDKIDKMLNEIKDGKYCLIKSIALENLIAEKKDIFLLDIRKKEDYDEVNIDNSVQCEWEEVSDLVTSDKLPLDKNIVVICYTGQSSMQVATLLSLKGYNAVSLLDGISGWINNEETK